MRIRQLRPRKLTDEERSDRILLASDALNAYADNVIGAEGEDELAVGLVTDLLHLVESRGYDANLVASVALCMYNLERSGEKGTPGATYRAVYVARNGEEMVMSEGEPTEEDAIEAAIGEAKDHDLIGPEWPQVTEDDFRNALRVEKEVGEADA